MSTRARDWPAATTYPELQPGTSVKNNASQVSEMSHFFMAFILFVVPAATVRFEAYGSQLVGVHCCDAIQCWCSAFHDLNVTLHTVQRNNR